MIKLIVKHQHVITSYQHLIYSYSRSLTAWYIGAAPDGQSSSSDRGQSGGHGSEGSGTERIGIQQSINEDRTERTGHHGSATLPATLGHSGTSGASQGSGGHPKFPSDEGSECSSVTSESLPG